MNDRFIATRSPISKKYRRVIEGLELGSEGSLETPKVQSSSTDPQAISNRTEARASVYRRLFGPEIVASRVSPSKTSVVENASSSSSFLSVETVTSGGNGKEFKTTSSCSVAQLEPFIAPVLYGKGSLRRRPLQSSPIRILDAPGLEDDFYLNLLDWEPRSNRVSVLLGGNEVYFWNAANLGGRALSSASSGISGALGRAKHANIADRGCVLKWSSATPSGSAMLAIGTKNGIVEIWDAERGTQVHSWLGHSGTRCGVLSWSGNDGRILSSGGRDHSIVHYDLRCENGIISTVPGAHTQEVCGLKYDQHGSGLLASGGNDNQLLVWDRRMDSSVPLLELNKHTAAVKAIDWSPHQMGLLASGGGTADRTIRFWNSKLPISASLNESSSNNYSSLKPIQASSQVCTLAWSPLASNEILSTHGFSEHNLSLWSYPTGQCLGSLDGHSQRVLFQAVGPDGATVVTGSGDETLRFWSVFRRPAASDKLQSINRSIRNDAAEQAFQASR